MKMNPKVIISNYFDSLINQIDIHNEEELAKTKENDLIDIENPFSIDNNNQLRLYKYDFSHQPSKHIPPGTVRVNEFLNTTREKLLAKLNVAQDQAFKVCDQIKDQLRVISKDESKSQEEREEEIKRKVFANKSFGLLRIDRIKMMKRFDKIVKNESPFKLFLVELDYFMGPDEQFIFR